MKKRLSFGRRKSDWLLPIGFLAVGVIAAFWASYNRTKKSDLQRQNEALKVQVQLLERVVEHYEKDRQKSVATGPRPTMPASVVVSGARKGKPGGVDSAGKSQPGATATPLATHSGATGP